MKRFTALFVVVLLLIVAGLGVGCTDAYALLIKVPDDEADLDRAINIIATSGDLIEVSNNGDDNALTRLSPCNRE